MSKVENSISISVSVIKTAWTFLPKGKIEVSAQSTCPHKLLFQSERNSNMVLIRIFTMLHLRNLKCPSLALGHARE